MFDIFPGFIFNFDSETFFRKYPYTFLAITPPLREISTTEILNLKGDKITF